MPRPTMAPYGYDVNWGEHEFVRITHRGSGWTGRYYADWSTVSWTNTDPSRWPPEHEAVREWASWKISNGPPEKIERDADLVVRREPKPEPPGLGLTLSDEKPDVQPKPVKPVEVPMTNANKPEETKLTNPTKRILVGGAKLAGGLQATDAVNETAVRLLSELMTRMGVPAEMLDNPVAHSSLKLIAPLVVANVAVMVPSLQAQATMVEKACTLAFAAELERHIAPAFQGMEAIVSEFLVACRAVEGV